MQTHTYTHTCSHNFIYLQVRCGLWVLSVYQRRFISCNKNTIIGAVDNWTVWAQMQNICSLSMCFPISFVVSLKLPENMKPIFKDPK